MKLWGPTYKIFRILIEAPPRGRPEIAVRPWLLLCLCFTTAKREQGPASSSEGAFRRVDAEFTCHRASREGVWSRTRETWSSARLRRIRSSFAPSSMQRIVRSLLPLSRWALFLRWRLYSLMTRFTADKLFLLIFLPYLLSTPGMAGRAYNLHPNWSLTEHLSADGCRHLLSRSARSVHR
jgi:hypothetical protein